MHRVCTVYGCIVPRVVITGTTVGFGDYSAQHFDSRMFLIFYLWAIVIAMGVFLNELQALTLGGNRNEIFKIKLSKDLIQALDKSGDGKISKIEWQQAMLTTLKVVDEGTGVRVHGWGGGGGWGMSTCQCVPVPVCCSKQHEPTAL